MVFQLRAIDKQRLLHKIGRLEEDKLKKVDAEIRLMLGLSLS
jgi:mRNA-degrading endonuclease toxin of MazEF toxin-antitoxin module